MALFDRLDADTLDGLIYVVNQLRQDPEERLQAYLYRCLEARYEGDQGKEQRLRDLGIDLEVHQVVGK